MKNWILKTFFAKELQKATLLGSVDAFEKAREDLEEMMIDKTEERGEALAEQKLRDMLSPVDLNAVVMVDRQKGFVFIGGERADEERLANLRSEAEMISQTNLWKLLQETPKKLAQDTMFVSGETLDDYKKGKIMLFLLSQQNNILELFRNYVKR